MMPAAKAEPRQRKERKENADRRRRQLIDAASRSIRKNGLAKTTLATVADEAGLSQGVVVFYFKTKEGLLAETLNAHYAAYEQTWRTALEEAGRSPPERMMALVRADFDPGICSPDMLAVWFAFWGELRFRPSYDEIAGGYDQRRAEAVAGVVAELSPGATEESTRAAAVLIDTLTDGLWLKMQLSGGAFTAGDAIDATCFLLRALFPGHDFGPSAAG